MITAKAENDIEYASRNVYDNDFGFYLGLYQLFIELDLEGEEQMNCPNCNAELIDLKNGYYHCPYEECPYHDCLIAMRPTLPHSKEIAQ